MRLQKKVIVYMAYALLGLASDLYAKAVKSLDSFAHKNVMQHCIYMRKKLPNGKFEAPSRVCIQALFNCPRSRALLDTIAYAEGTDAIDKNGESRLSGYKILYGNGRSRFLYDHPRAIQRLTRHGMPLSSSAAGRYQLLSHIWDTISRQLHLPSFGPREQDFAALYLIAEKQEAVLALLTGDIASLCTHIHPIWPSFPGNRFTQVRTTVRQIEQFFWDRCRVYEEELSRKV